MSSNLLTQDEAIQYWEERHKSSSMLQAGGDKGLSNEANVLFYALRAGKLLELIGRKHNLLSPLRILDAGCGRGLLSDLLSRGGHAVLGIDSSKTGIEYCTSSRSGRYVCSRIDDFTTHELFDVVYSVDVMFHILDDKIWKNSLANLCNMVDTDGLLIVTGAFLERRWTKGDYIVHRSRDEYFAAAQQSSMSFIDFHPYDFGGNPVGFYVFERM